MKTVRERIEEVAAEDGRKVVSDIPPLSIYTKLSREGTYELVSTRFEKGAEFGFRLAIEELRAEQTVGFVGRRLAANYLESKLKEEV